MEGRSLEQLPLRLSAEAINEMPLCHYEGPVSVIRTLNDWKTALEDIENDRILGFDTETRPTFRKGKINAPSLIQLATASRVYLIQLVWLPFGQYIADVLANPAIVKAGVAIRCDMEALAKIFPFTARGLVDLGNVARSNKLSTQGLRTLAANFFGMRISKGSQCSNWSLMELSQKQILYAATDAWIGRLIYLRMRELNLQGSEPST